jgi:hypothetical protein
MKGAPIKRTSTFFLQAVLILIGIGALVALLWEPHLEGRNAHATLFEIYFKDPFLAYVYGASIAFFVALYQACTVLGHIGRNNLFSPDSLRALRTIKYCGLSLIAFVVVAEGYILLPERGEEDIAGGVAMGLFAMVIFIVITATAAVLEGLLQRAVDMKSEQDLTV